MPVWDYTYPPQVEGKGLLAELGTVAGGTPPTERQERLFREATDACSYDFWRLQDMGIFFATVPAEYLYNGRTGGFYTYSTVEWAKEGGVYVGAGYAPAVEPYGAYGDYAALRVDGHPLWGGGHFGADALIYIVDDLDRRPRPYGGDRFFRETIIRMLGLLVVYRFAHDPWRINRLARLFTPVDRPSFDGDARGYETAQWMWEEVGIECEPTVVTNPEGMDYLNVHYPQGSVIRMQTPENMAWGRGLARNRRAPAWEARLAQAAAETFKDLYLRKSMRQFTNRSAVKLRGTFEEFHKVISEEDSPFYPWGADWNYSDATARPIIDFRPPHPDGKTVGAEYDVRQSLRFGDIPFAPWKGAERYKIQIGPVQGDPTLNPPLETHFGWHIEWQAVLDVNHQGQVVLRDPVGDTPGVNRAELLPYELEIPIQWVKDAPSFSNMFTWIRFIWHGAARTDDLGDPSVDLVEVFNDYNAVRPDSYFFIHFADQFHFHGYYHDLRVELITLPGVPRYPASGVLTIAGHDSGARVHPRAPGGRQAADIGTVARPIDDTFSPLAPGALVIEGR